MGSRVLQMDLVARGGCKCVILDFEVSRRVEAPEDTRVEVQMVRQLCLTQILVDGSEGRSPEEVVDEGAVADQAVLSGDLLES